MHAADGFCDAEVVSVGLVDYFWPETVAGNETSLSCILGTAEEGGMARRLCDVMAEWTEPSLGECLNGEDVICATIWFITLA